ncbi:hypothetical protein [Geodermatophilus maliterrae]|uniref:MYXO-CTERM domain-containing protein n=1 Tax=Geodermatophilus maliterrae TaxID=3162531 RepID=A0ABV3XFN9_9ACTN
MARSVRPATGPRLRDVWWVFGLVLVAACLFGTAFVVRLRCLAGACVRPAVGQLLDLEAVGGLPRLFTAGVFVAAAVLAWRGRPTGWGALWWTVVAGTVLGLAVLKLASAHSIVKGATSPWTTLLLGLAVTVPGLCLLYVAGRAWRVPATGSVVAVLGAYALTALGLDVVTTAAAVVQTYAGARTGASAAFVEEFGEALAALGVLAVVRWWTAVSRRGR